MGTLSLNWFLDLSGLAIAELVMLSGVKRICGLSGSATGSKFTWPGGENGTEGTKSPSEWKMTLLTKGLVYLVKASWQK